jgi:hypothetical protein
MNGLIRCDDVQEYLAERLTGRLSDRLSRTVYSQVRTHMLSCLECCEQLEHFQEMQQVLHTIPVEPCDSTAMRARFHLMMDAIETGNRRGTRTRSASRIRPLQVALVSLAAIVAVIALFVATRQALKWISFGRRVPALSTPIATRSPEPTTAESSPDIVSADVPIPSVPLEMAEITGRVLLEDGTDVSDAESPGQVAIISASNSSGIAATTMRLDRDGRFHHIMAAGEYRFRITEFSQNYLIRSITAGGIDLLKEDLKVSRDSSASVEIRVARRNDSGAGKVLGHVLDSVTNAPSQSDLVVLCCFASGAAERIFTPLRSDGSFEFDAVPPGSYTAELRGSSNLAIVHPEFNVGPAGISGLKLISVPQLVAVDVTLQLDNGDRLPYWPDTSIVFTGMTGNFQVAASCVVGNLFRAHVPAGEAYTLTVSNVAAGFAVRSIVDTRRTDLMRGGTLWPSVNPSAPSRIVVTLTRN